MTFLSVLIWILTFVLILTSFFMIMVVLMQKSKDGGIGTALAGGAAEAAFGAETANVLTRATKYSAIVFFVLAFALYMGRIYERKHGRSGGAALPNIAAPAALPTMPAGATTPASKGGTAPGVMLPPAKAPATANAPVTNPPATATPASAPAPEATKKP